MVTKNNKKEFEITEEEREMFFEMDLKIAKFQEARERGELTKEMKEADEAFRELLKLPIE